MFSLIICKFECLYIIKCINIRKHHLLPRSELGTFESKMSGDNSAEKTGPDALDWGSSPSYGKQALNDAIRIRMRTDPPSDGELTQEIRLEVLKDVAEKAQNRINYLQKMIDDPEMMPMLGNRPSDTDLTFELNRKKEVLMYVSNEIGCLVKS